VRNPTDRYLPPDRDAFVAAEPPTGRVIVIAPTRAACETIEIAVGLHLDTYLEQHHGARVRELARSRAGFGIVAGTGTGKTLAIRPIAEEIVGQGGQVPLRVGVVNREREATPELPVAERDRGDHRHRPPLVPGRRHPAARHARGRRDPPDVGRARAVPRAGQARRLPLHLALRHRRPAVLRALPRLGRRARGLLVRPEARRQGRGRGPHARGLPRRPLPAERAEGAPRVGVFLPTRAGVEETAASVAMRYPRIHAAYYHGGEPIRVIRPFLEGDGQQPYVLAMTAAGQSALNVRGLDTVVIDDTRFTNVVERGRNVLTRTHLGRNEILQMAGRVHGRVEGGRVFILSDRDIDFATLRPTEPEFQLAGDSERVALTCAALGVRADELELRSRSTARRTAARWTSCATATSSTTPAACRRTAAPSRRSPWTARGPSCSSTPTTSCSPSSPCRARSSRCTA
jgi:hypothetical protein